MIHEADLNILVSNVVSENDNKHCRLCLKETVQGYIKFTDFVSYDEEFYQPLDHILTELLGSQILDEVPGVNVVCPDCLQKALECYRFIEETKKASEILNKTFHNLTEALSVDLDVTDNFQRVYVVVGKEESVIILADKDGINRDILKETPKILKSKKNTFYKKQETSTVFAECNYLPSPEEQLKEHSIELHTLNCIDCKKVFVSEESLKQHKESEHGAHIFKECEESFNALEKLQTHEESHTIDSNYKTNNYDKAHKPKKNTKLCRSAWARKHKLEQDTDLTPHVCKECGKTCLGLEKLQAHEEKHVKYECPKCSKGYLTNDFYLKHVELCLSEKLEVHPFRAKMEKKYRCDECDKGYSCQAGLKVHKKFVHGNFTGHVCEICGKVFSAPSYLKTHMVKHTGEKKFQCDICSKYFVSKEALLYHIRRHTGEKPYSCNLCEERFVNASARAEHIKYKHQSPKFPCDICGKKFFTTSFLKIHQQKHSDPSSKLFTGASRMRSSGLIKPEENTMGRARYTPGHLKKLKEHITGSSTICPTGLKEPSENITHYNKPLPIQPVQQNMKLKAVIMDDWSVQIK